MPSSACESCTARLMMVASTVSRSSEEFTARSTSSSAWSSATERVSSAVRSRKSRKLATLVMAMTACSAKVCNSAIWLSVKPPGCLAVQRDGADRLRRRAATGSPRIDCHAQVAHGLGAVRLGVDVANMDDLPVQNCPAGDGPARRRHRERRAKAGDRVSGIDAVTRPQREWTSLPSNSNNPAEAPLHSSCARRVIRSNTGWVSSGEADITFSTSMVADCCSIRSPNSLLRCGQRRGARLQFAIRLGAADGDHRLLGEGLQQLDLAVGEAARFRRASA